MVGRYATLSPKEYNKKYYELHRQELLAARNAWNRTHPEQINAVARKRGTTVKLAVLSHYSPASPPRCLHCGIVDLDVLCIDHMNNNGAEERKIGGFGVSFYYWLERNGFPEGYQVLCWNCNHKKDMVRRRETRGEN